MIDASPAVPRCGGGEHYRMRRNIAGGHGRVPQMPVDTVP
jgi:hypothetical protein